MPRRLLRKNNTGHLHFITTSCYCRMSVLGKARRRDLFLAIFEQVRRSYGFLVVGYVVMPEHIHLLISEPEPGDISTIMQVLKQRFARRVLREWRSRVYAGQENLWGASGTEHVWQKRFYDFLVLSEKKKAEKLRYIHRNPVRRGLVLEPGQWRWSSYRFYAFGEAGQVFVDRETKAKIKVGATSRFGG
ncbi:MAG TPA: transposase [Terriglobales bacterium]|nr:transposase [Terriglobales bacterium]